VVDGTENTPSNLYTQRMNEVQKYVTLSNHGYIGYAVIVNRKFWSGLPDDVRTALDGAMRDATRYANEIAKRENDDALAKIKATGKTELISLTPAQTADWRRALSKVHRGQEQRIGPDLVRDVYRATGQSM
jgi:C4-dicarboxylate-binding protein DctP